MTIIDVIRRFYKRALLTPVLRSQEFMPKPIIVILFPIVLALSSRAEDWPQWRGSGRDGVWHERGIRKTFPTGGLPVRWRAPVGYGFSSRSEERRGGEESRSRWSPEHL